MTLHSRRGFLLGLGGTGLVLAGCGNGLNSDGGAKIDARVQATIRQMHAEVPDAQILQNKAVGMLVMPLVTEAGFGVGGAYGRGALLVNGATVDYYSQARASFGFQVGAQQFAHVLFFMTEDALANFRLSPGVTAGGDVKYVVANEGGRYSADTMTVSSPVVAVVFGQAGLILGATLEGVKYTRIIP